MKKREIFLDFTALLDVVLIILFFFILFSYMEIEENKATVDLKLTEARLIIEDAEDLINQLEAELDIVRMSDKRSASNLEAMLDFNRGDNVKLILFMKDDGWVLNVTSLNKFVTKIESDSDIAEGIIEALVVAGHDINDTLFCEFILNGSEPGTASAYRIIDKALDTVKANFKYFYYSKTDISIAEDLK